MKVLVCGSRSWRDGLEIHARLAGLPAGSEIIHGAAPGADSYAAVIGRRLGLKVTEFPADWKRLGKRAGIVRNLEMLDQKPDLVLAFWDGQSPGTWHTISEAHRRKIAVVIVTGDTPGTPVPVDKPSTRQRPSGDTKQETAQQSQNTAPWPSG